MYILSESKLLEELLQTYNKPSEMSINYLITLLAKHFWSENKTISSLSENVKEEMIKFNITDYQEYIYSKKINEICTDICNNSDKRILKELDFIPVYQSDINLISSLPTDKHKKIMFTLIVNARYMNSNGWINKKTESSITQLFKDANINGGSDLRNGLLYELYIKGYISFAKANMNQNIKINHFEHDDIIAYKVTDFKNLGNQYLGNFKNGYMMCEKCGKIVRKSNNRRKYCKHCYEDINREQTQERMAKIRKLY